MGYDILFHTILYKLYETIFHLISYAKKKKKHVHIIILQSIYIYIIICTRELLSNQGFTRCCEVDSTWINVGPSELDMDGSPSCGGFKPQLSHLAFLWISMAFCGCKHCKLRWLLKFNGLNTRSVQWGHLLRSEANPDLVIWSIFRAPLVLYQIGSRGTGHCKTNYFCGGNEGLELFPHLWTPAYMCHVHMVSTPRTGILNVTMGQIISA